MKLQINDAGSWRHISRFNASGERDVRRLAPQLAAVLNERATLRILDDAGAVRAYCGAPDYNWEEKS